MIVAWCLFVVMLCLLSVGVLFLIYVYLLFMFWCCGLFCVYSRFVCLAVGLCLGGCLRIVGLGDCRFVDCWWVCF